MISVALAAVHSPLTPLPGVVSILVIPGASVMSMLKTRPASAGGRAVLAVCLSMLVVMVVGGGAESPRSAHRYRTSAQCCDSKCHLGVNRVGNTFGGGRESPRSSHLDV